MESSFTFTYVRFTLEVSLEIGSEEKMKLSSSKTMPNGKILSGRQLANLAMALSVGLPLVLNYCGAPAFSQSPTVLKGRVEDQGAKNNPSGLSRTDLSPNSPDPFADDKDDQEILEPGAGAYAMEAPRVPDKKKSFGASISQHVPAAMAPMNPMVSPYDGEAEPMLPPQSVPRQQPLASQVTQNDPDNSPDMQLAWDIWHKRVAESIYTRFNFLAKLGFKHSPPLLCKVSYVVTRDGHINNIQVTQKSSNILFNVIVFQTVKSLDGDLNLLQFPNGSRRMFVPKVGTFTQNYGGDGFRYTVGDRETLQGQGR